MKIIGLHIRSISSKRSLKGGRPSWCGLIISGEAETSPKEVI